MIKSEVDRAETRLEVLVDERKTSTEEILVHLVGPGVGVRDYHLSFGATLADLLRLSETETASQAVLIDGVLSEEALPLHEGAVVTFLQQTAPATDNEPWRSSTPASQDEALFQEYSDTVKARRQELKLDEKAPLP